MSDKDKDKTSNYVKVNSAYDWKETGIIYWQGKEIDRYSKEYDDLIDELYICAIQNPLYRNLLKTTDRYILQWVEKKKRILYLQDTNLKSN